MKKQYEILLKDWIKFRNTLETSTTPFEDVICYYNTLAKCKLSVDPWDICRAPAGALQISMG